MKTHVFVFFYPLPRSSALQTVLTIDKRSLTEFRQDVPTWLAQLKLCPQKLFKKFQLFIIFLLTVLT
jgi:hypothetical protein